MLHIDAACTAGLVGHGGCGGRGWAYLMTGFGHIDVQGGGVPVLLLFFPGCSGGL